jgi:hypothetical protein
VGVGWDLRTTIFWAAGTASQNLSGDIDNDLYSVLFHTTIMESTSGDGPTIAAAVAAGATDDPGLTSLEPLGLRAWRRKLAPRA